MKKILPQIIKHKEQNTKLLCVLLDPDKVTDLKKTTQKLLQFNPDFILIGGSFLSQNNTNLVAEHIKKETPYPVIIFPGNYHQITHHADALLFLSLISGRNPEFLIGQHVLAAPILYQSNIEIIPTGYILIESGKSTSVEYISNTRPIPADKPEIALATALAGEMLGMQLIYLEAGSGAQKPVPLKTVRLLSKNLRIPLIVGGGIKSNYQIKQYFEAGADIIVVGTAFEKDNFVDKKSIPS